MNESNVFCLFPFVLSQAKLRKKKTKNSQKCAKKKAKFFVRKKSACENSSETEIESEMKIRIKFESECETKHNPAPNSDSLFGYCCPTFQY